MNIRFATFADSAALQQIYAQYIDTPVTFAYTLPTAEEFAAYMQEVQMNYPYLICEENGTVAGYAYAHRQMAREAYQWNAELSIYLDSNAVSKGYGTRLYRALINLLRLQGVKTVYGGVTLPNEKSVRLHLSLGFRQLGIYHNTGYKCGAWRDVAWFEKAIAPYDTAPKPIIPIQEIEEQKIHAVFCSGMPDGMTY